MYWNQTQNQWIPVESHIDQNSYLVCKTTHFSTWTVADVDPELITENMPIYAVAGLTVILAVVSLCVKQKSEKSPFNFPFLFCLHHSNTQI
jgi:hypothetical protein